MHRRGPWQTPEQVELATLEYIDWWNNRRLHTEIGDVPPAETEEPYYAERELIEQAAAQVSGPHQARRASTRRLSPSSHSPLLTPSSRMIPEQVDTLSSAEPSH